MNKNFAGLPDEFTTFAAAKVLLQSIPYDGTSTWGKGANNGFEAFLDAAENMELFDIETQSEVYKKGVHILPAITEDSSPEAMKEAVLNSTRQLIKTGKFLTFFGGEHSVSIGTIEAFCDEHENLTVLQLDAHADLRPEYAGSACNHACAAHHASQHCNLVQVGIRSMDESERPFISSTKCFFAHQMQENKEWMQKAIDQMTDKVYLTIDLDALDPAIMPATGTPEPGGMQWYETLQFLKMVFQQKEVVAFDIVELAPIENLKHPQFLVAKLYYKLLSYKFLTNDK
ncbi:MAG: agmatinase [Salinivirgaceae bacterium]|jgi:agmatinase|nr:agmatinase [Salinivirgaceae bacterium]